VKCLTATVIAALAVIAFPTLAGAAASPAPESPGITAKLVEFPASVGPKDSLRLGVEVANPTGHPAQRLRIAFSLYEGVTSRSQLTNTFRGNLGALLGSDTISADGELAPGEKRVLVVEKPLVEISAIRSSAAEDRAYPIRIVVRTSQGSSNQIDTHMIFFSAPPAEPLRISLIVPLHSPSVYSDGAHPSAVTSSSLENSARAGRLNTVLGALERYPQVPVTLAPSGLLLDTLAGMSNGFLRETGGKIARVPPDDPRAELATRTLARIRLLASRPATRVMAMPYSAAFLPALVRNNLDDLAQAQASASRDRLTSPLGGLTNVKPLEGWLLPAYGALDERALSALQRSGTTHVIVSSDSFREPAPSLTQAKPVEVETRTGSVTALIEDSGLGGRLAESSGEGPVADRQRFLAETATIMLERPAQKRGLCIVAPLDWAPDPAFADGVISGLITSPWLQPEAPEALLTELPSSGKGVQAASLENVLHNGPDLPGLDYFTALKDARSAIQRFADLAPPPDRLAFLQRRLLIAESADWWGARALQDKGRGFARAIPPELEAQMRRIRAPGAQIITLTSRTGVIPLSIGSGLGYPVDVVMRLDSDKLRFPAGNEVTVQKLQPPNQTIEVKTIAQATGTFPLRVRIQSPTGTVLSESRLTIRSTAYNQVAVAITAGAALFLFAWWVFGSLKQKQAA